MVNKKLGIGIIGAGRIGYVHARSIINNVAQADVIAISDVVVENARKIAQELGIENVYSDYRDILARDDVDAVLVCSPTNTHADIAMDAAKAGKHIFCEKPIDLSIEKIRLTKSVVEQADVKMQIGFNRRFDHNFKRIHDLRESGALGDVQIVRITSRDPAPPSAEYAAVSGGMFLDMTIHDFDMARYQAGSEVVEVYAKGAVLVDPAIGKAGDIDTAIITLLFESGAIGVIDNCRKAVYGYDQRVEVFGSKGAAEAANDTATNVRLSRESDVVVDKPLYFFLERYMQSFADEITRFVESIVQDTPVPVGIEDGLKPIIIAKAAKMSMDLNRPVKLSEVKD